METQIKSRSRKLDLCVFAMLLMAGGYLLSNESPILQANFSTLCGAITSIYAIYVGGNSATKYIYNRKPKESKASNS